MMRVVLLTGLLVAPLFLTGGCEKKKDEGTSSSGGVSYPDYSGTWKGTFNDPSTVGSQSLTVVISNWSCGNNVCSFDATWDTPTYSIPLTAGTMTNMSTTQNFQLSLVYNKGCSGADLATGVYNAGSSRFELNVTGDCSVAGLALIKKS